MPSQRKRQAAGRGRGEQEWAEHGALGDPWSDVGPMTDSDDGCRWEPRRTNQTDIPR